MDVSEMIVNILAMFAGRNNLESPGQTGRTSARSQVVGRSSLANTERTESLSITLHHRLCFISFLYIIKDRLFRRSSICLGSSQKERHRDFVGGVAL